jgi:hypothetical protein
LRPPSGSAPLVEPKLHFFMSDATPAVPPAKPKAFLSYSWSSPAHEHRIIEWAKRLAGDGIDIVLDKFELKGGQDKNAFMEKMVNDQSVTHVLVFTDKAYAEKANARKAGVGTESQIISEQVYRQVTQTKFIPIICEKDENGEPFLPTFMSSRIWFDFSTDEKVNENWESLIRFLYGKPVHQKPPIGAPPSFVTESSSTPINPAAGKFATLRQAIVTGSRTLKLSRSDFIETCFAHVESLRVKSNSEDDTAEVVVGIYRQLIPTRNILVDWVMLEAQANLGEDFTEALSSTLERMLEMASPPASLSQYYNHWFDGHRIFVYECFLYFIAALLRAEAFKCLNAILMGSYLHPNAASRREQFVRFGAFYAFSEYLKSKMRPDGDANSTYKAPVVELMKRHAERTDVPFEKLIEADALVWLASMMPPAEWWYPQTLYYASYHNPLFFTRAAQHRHFLKLATILGVTTAAEIRTAVQANKEEGRSNVGFYVSVPDMFNLEKLDTIK